MDDGAANRGDGGRESAGQHLDVDVLNALVDGRLSPGERAAASAHLEGCTDCRRELAELRATVDLLRGLPQFAPRRSFQLLAPPARRGWFERLLPSLPALRAVTVAVAVLLVAVTAGDIVSNQTSDADRPLSQPRAAQAPTQPAQESRTGARAGTETTDATSDEEAAPPAARIAAETEVAAAPAPADAVADEAAAERNQESDAFDQAPPPPPAAAASEAEGQSGGNAAGAAAPEAAPAIEEGAPSVSGGSGAGAQEPAANVFAGSTDTADTAAETGIDGDAVPAPAGSFEQAVTAPPTAAVATPTPPAPAPAGAPDAGQPGALVEDDEETGTRPSNWRLAEVALGLLLLWLLVSLVGLQRLKRRPGVPG